MSKKTPDLEAALDALAETREAFVVVLNGDAPTELRRSSIYALKEALDEVARQLVAIRLGLS